MLSFGVFLPQVAVTITFEIFAEDGEQVCGIFRLQGKVNKPPKAWLRTMREELRKIEQIARDAGCAEMRLGGRDWSRILPDYEPLDGVPNGLRKRL